MQTTLTRTDWEALLAGSKTPDPAWADALQAVTSAPFELVVLAGAMGNFALGRYHRLPAGELVAAVEDAEGSVHLTGPVKFEEIVSLLDAVLDFDGASAGVTCDLELDAEELSCILALVDVLKERQLRAALAREPMAPAPVSAAELTAQLTRAANEDPLWWVPCGRLLFPFPLATGELASAQQRLRARGVLNDQGLPGPAGAELIGSLLMPLSAASITFLGGVRAEAPQAVDAQVAVRTATAFWTFLARVESGQPRVRVVAGQAMQLLVHLDELYTTYTRDFPYVAQGRPCPHCQTLNPTGAGFCAHCGQSMAPPACPSCGAALPGGARFCAACGAGRPAAPAPECARCHQPLAPDQKFCGSCGAPVAAAPPPPRTCACGRALAPESRFCPGCGQKV